MSDQRRPFVAGLLVGAAGAMALAAVIVTLFGSGDEDDMAAQALEVIQENYFEEIQGSALEDASVQGMVEELRRRYDDRFTHYFPPRTLDQFERSTAGEFSGVGLTVNDVARGLRVADVLPDTPAEAADLQPGDVITAVDGRSIAGVPAEVSTARIKGPSGTEVELRIVSATTGRTRRVTLERADVRVPAASGEIVRAGGTRVAHVDYASFTSGAHGELRETIEEQYRRGARGLVLDLRGNGGGLLNEAVLSASLFVPRDETIVTTDSRAHGHREYEAVGDPLDPRPTVVLINRDSASASEILAAALDHYDLATVVGTRSYGKGTFQEVIELPAGGALDLTIGQYLAADGTSLAGGGVVPEVHAADDPDTRRDEALRTALQVLAPELRAGAG